MPTLIAVPCIAQVKDQIRIELFTIVGALSPKTSLNFASSKMFNVLERRERPNDTTQQKETELLGQSRCYSVVLMFF
jgi:hypothetical protein